MIEENISVNPKVCVCIPSYNAAATIIETLTSLQQQTYQNLTIIVVDNASTDSTCEIIKKIATQDNRVELRAFDTNIGGEGNFTRCIQLSKGDYTAIYHADDCYCPTIIEEEVALLNKSEEIGAVFTGAYTIDSSGRTMGKTGTLPPVLQQMNKNVFNYNEILSAIMRHSNFFVFPSAMVRTSIYQKEIIAWNAKEFGTSADLDVWLRISQKHLIGYISKPLMKYRTSSASYSFRIKYARIGYADFFKVMDSYIESNKLQITTGDKHGYVLLKKKDAILRARNFLVSGNTQEARAILKETLDLSLLSGNNTYNDLKHIVIGYVTLILTYISIGPLLYKTWHKAKSMILGIDKPVTSIIKVAQIRWGEPIGGVERVLSDLAYFVDRNAFHMKFIFLRSGGSYESEMRANGHDVVVIPACNGYDISMRITLIKELRDFSPDIINEHGIPPLLRPIIKIAVKAPLITFEHGEIEVNKRKGKPWLNLIHGFEIKYFSNIIITNSGINKTLIANTHSIPQKRIKVIYLGIDLDAFTLKLDEPVTNELVIGYIGRHPQF